MGVAWGPVARTSKVLMQPHPHFVFPKTKNMSAEFENELFSACEAGDVERVRNLVIIAGVDPKKAIRKDIIFAGDTPLHAACRYIKY